MRKRFIILSLMLLFTASILHSDSVIKKSNYRGWADSYQITDGVYSVIVVPEIGGRIMEYSKNGVNLFWQNSELFGQNFSMVKKWHNYGGFQVWAAPQELWGWPPDPYMDFGRCNAEVIGNPGNQKLRITGAANLNLGLISTRDISMNNKGEVSVVSTIHNISGKTIKCGAWNVTYMQTPAFAAFPIKSGSKFKGGIEYFTAKSKQSKQFSVIDNICITEYMNEDGLIGSDSDGPWLVYFNKNIAYIKQINPMEKNAAYPNNGCSVQILTSSAQFNYIELETFSPLKSLKPGESISNTERWRIQELTQPVLSKKDVIKAINGMKGKKWLP